ncbi:cytochrome P450 [Amycolatopsis sp. NPDC004747]
MTETTQETAPRVTEFPQHRTCPYQPPPGYAELAEQGALAKVGLYDGQEAWVVTRFAEARQLLGDLRVSSNLTLPGFPILSPRMESIRDSHPAFIEMDPPEHTVYRRMLSDEFTTTRMRALRPEVERIVDEAIDRLLAHEQPVDLVHEFGVPVPLMVICRLLGVSLDTPEAFAFFQDAGHRLVQATTAEEAHRAGGDIYLYLDRVVTEQEKDPGPGLIGRLARDEFAAGRMTHQDLVQITMLLLIAGYETTAMMVALGVITMLAHPEQLAKLRSDPDGWPNAVEELLRYLAVADVAALRVAREDIEVGECTIRAGEGVIMASSMTNRDAAAFPDPDTFDVDRNARHHLSFGWGVHQCLGANLARLELQVIMPKLFERIPTLRLAVPVEELSLNGPGTTQGVAQLPIAW